MKNLNKTKVCHIITKLELGGAQQNTLYTVSNLSKEKYIPLLISGKNGFLDNEACAIPGLKLFFIPKLIRPICPFCDFIAFLRITKILLKEKPDIVHTHSSKAGIIGRWAAWFAKVPIVIHTFHGFGFNKQQSFLVRNFFILLEKITALITHKLVVVAQENINDAMNYKIGTKEQYMVIRSGIEIDKFKNSSIDKDAKKEELNILEDEKVITTIGPFKPQKNLKDFIKIANLISETNNNCKFLIIGDGDLRPQLELLVQGYDLTEKIIFLGWQRSINEILAISDIFVLTSLWEGLPRSMIEAMSSSVPVIANAVDGVKEIIKDGENGFLSEPFNIKKTADLSLKLLNDPELAKKIGTAGKNSIQKEFDIDFMVQQQEELYMEMYKIHLAGDSL